MAFPFYVVHSSGAFGYYYFLPSGGRWVSPGAWHWERDYEVAAVDYETSALRRGKYFTVRGCDGGTSVTMVDTLTRIFSKDKVYEL